VGVGAHGHSPYKACLTHGFVVDGQGRKMSKSLGNTVSPEQIIKQYGAEVMRLWVASSDYRDDVRLSDQILKGLSEGYRKIRNTLRYALSNLYDFNPREDAVEFENLLPLDRWALGRLDALIARVTQAYENYEFHMVYHAVVDFCAMELSSLYFDILKDRLYTSKANGEKRRSAQTVLYRLAQDLLRLLAPVMSFTSEEAWQALPLRPSDSVFLAGFPEVEKKADEALTEEFEKLFAVRSAVQPLLEASRRDKMIGSSLEAKVVLTATGEAAKFLSAHARELASMFIVSQVELATAASEGAQPLNVGTLFGTSTLHAEIYIADGQKCPRCWAYSKEVASEGDLCPKCEEALA
jgi:isoleucyl-tRNA synthetase